MGDSAAGARPLLGAARSRLRQTRADAPVRRAEALPGARRLPRAAHRHRLNHLPCTDQARRYQQRCLLLAVGALVGLERNAGTGRGPQWWRLGARGDGSRAAHVVVSRRAWRDVHRRLRRAWPRVRRGPARRRHLSDGARHAHRPYLPLRASVPAHVLQRGAAHERAGRRPLLLSRRRHVPGARGWRYRCVRRAVEQLARGWPAAVPVQGAVRPAARRQRDRRRAMRADGGAHGGARAARGPRRWW